MRILLLPTTRPSFNLAAEEYLLRQTVGDWFVLWRNERSIIVGKNQNTHAEINYDFVSEHQLPVIRRLTGGGAVFHDLGNVNFTFVERDNQERFSDYRYFTRPIVELLQSLGVPAELSGRNDLLIDGKKFSGNAQCSDNGSMMHHGTLMFSADVSDLTAALHVNPLKIQSKGIRSVSSRVTNIADHLPQRMTVETFIQRLLEKVEQENPQAERYALTSRDIEAIEKLETQKYATWEWNFGFRKEYAFRKEARFPGCCLEVNMDIAEDRVRDIRFFGDFFGVRDVSELEGALRGVPYRPDALLQALNGQPIGEYFSGMTAEMLMQVMM